MKRRSRDEERGQRITMEIVVDAHTAEEQAMGWYYSLEDRLDFPFVARCIAERSISPLRVGDEVDVVGMAPEEECTHEMLVLIPWERRTLAVPLAQLEGVAVDDHTRQVIDAWRYWVAKVVSCLNDQGGARDHSRAGQPGTTATQCCAAARGLDEEPSRELNIEAHRAAAAWRDDLLAAAVRASRVNGPTGHLMIRR